MLHAPHPRRPCLPPPPKNPLLPPRPQYLRSALAPPSCVDVLLLAHHYHCAELRRDAVRHGRRAVL